MDYAFYETRLGWLKIGCDGDRVVSLRVVPTMDGTHQPSSLSDQAARQVQDYLAGQRTDFDFPWEAHGTPFQQRVWQALCAIPYGQTRSYSQIAAMAGNPKACRAVGAANHHNPLWLVIPCHRVVGAGGSLTGYAGGLEMKQALLSLEASHG